MNIPILAAEFPFKAIPPCLNSIELISDTMRYRGPLSIEFVVRLVWWKGRDGEPNNIDDVIEQQVDLPADGPGMERYLAAILAFRQLTTLILAGRPAGLVMPSDLFRHLGSVLLLVKPTSVAHYRSALGVPSRLGRYLGPGLDYWSNEAW